MDLGRLLSPGASEQVKSCNQGNLKNTHRTYYADPALGRALSADTVCLQKKQDNAEIKKGLLQQLSQSLQQVLKNKQTEIASAYEPSTQIRDPRELYDAYVEDIDISNKTPGKEKKVPISFKDYEKLHQNALSMYVYGRIELDHFNKKYFSHLTDDFESVGIRKFSSRPKGIESVQAKLVKKFEDGQINNPSSFDECIQSIGDLEGGRLTIQNLQPEFALEVLDKYGVSEKDYADFMLGEKDRIGDMNKSESSQVVNQISQELKELHTQNIVNRLLDLIRTGRLTFNDEFNNYGSQNTSYFTNGQIQQIADAHFNAVHKPLPVVSSINFENEKTFEVPFDADNNKTGVIEVKIPGDDDHETVYSMTNADNIEIAEIKSKKSIKKSGYSATQFNMLCDGSDGTRYSSELQIRGEAVNTYAEGEHVIYDILSGKTKINDEKHGEECRLINSLDKNSKKELYNCLKYVYTHGRLEEFGIKTDELNFNKYYFTTPDGTDKSEEVRNMLNNVFDNAKLKDAEDTIKFDSKNPSLFCK